MDSTLIEQAKLMLKRDETLRAIVMEVFAQKSDLLQHLPFRNVTMAYDKDKKKAVVDGMENEAITIAGGDLDVDNELVKEDKYGRGKFEVKLIASLAKNTTKVLIKGSSERYKEINGLQDRCTKEQQVIDNNGVLQISNLEMLIASVDKPTHLFMSKTMRRRIVKLYHDMYDFTWDYQKCLDCDTIHDADTCYTKCTPWREYFDDIGNNNNPIAYELDNFGCRSVLYKKLPILIAGQDECFEEIFPFTEKDPSGIQQCTSIYCLSLAEDGLIGLQYDYMDVKDLGDLTELESEWAKSKPVHRTRVEWFVGLTTIRPRSIARLRYIKDGLVKI